MIKLYTVELKTDIDKYYKKFINLLSKERQKKIKKFINKDDMYRTILGEVLIRAIICFRFNIKNEDISFIKNRYRKLFLQQYPDFYFNISYSGK